MSFLFLRKISRFVRLSAEEERLLLQLCAKRARLLGARQDMLLPGEPVQAIRIVEAGWAGRYRTLPDGRRQIVALLLPGDVCDTGGAPAWPGDDVVTTLTPVSVREVPRDAFEPLARRYPNLMDIRWREHLLAASIQREWTVSLGLRNARERMAHLLCEVMLRLQLVGLSDGVVCEFPLTQIDLGDATGLSTVHVNRTLQELRAAGLVTLRDRQLHVADFEALAEMAMFEPAYLGVEPRGMPEKVRESG